MNHTFIAHASRFFEEWNWRNSIEQGIGMSETHQVELLWRLARRGHRCISYSPHAPTEWRGTEWRDVREKPDYAQEGIWLIYRTPETIDEFKPIHPGQQIWMIMQDEDAPGWNEARALKADKVFGLCAAHCERMKRRYPYLADKLCMTRNGVKVDLIREVEAEGVPERNPNRLMWASSPDRGLKYLLRSFRRAREFNRDLELHCFYGFNNIDKLKDSYPWMAREKAEIEREMDQPGVVWRGRVGQKDLYREWLKTGLCVYQSNFFETGWATGAEAQALGAVPIGNPIGAVSEVIQHGMFIPGDAYSDPLVQARWAGEIVRWTTQPELQEHLRADMMRDIRERFNWERFVDQFEALADGWSGVTPMAQFAFQRKNAEGRVLNIGSGGDPFDWKGRLGAVNLDVLETHPLTGASNAADIVADARDPRVFENGLRGAFDTVIIGDVLEHMSPDDAVAVLRNARTALRDNGSIVITMPFDRRGIRDQAEGEYAPGVPLAHCDSAPYDPVTLTRLLREAGLECDELKNIDYTFAEGVGLVCKAR